MAFISSHFLPDSPLGDGEATWCAHRHGGRFAPGTGACERQASLQIRLRMFISTLRCGLLRLRSRLDFRPVKLRNRVCWPCPGRTVPRCASAQRRLPDPPSVDPGCGRACAPLISDGRRHSTADSSRPDSTLGLASRARRTGDRVNPSGVQFHEACSKVTCRRHFGKHSRERAPDSASEGGRPA